MVAKLNNSLDLCKTNKLTPIIQNWITGVILKTDNSILKTAYNSPGRSSPPPDEGISGLFGRLDDCLTPWWLKIVLK